MKSKLAESAKRSTSAAMLRLSPEQRLDAFVAHCRLMMDLYRAGQELRAALEDARLTLAAAGSDIDTELTIKTRITCLHRVSATIPVVGDFPGPAGHESLRAV